MTTRRPHRASLLASACALPRLALPLFSVLFCVACSKSSGAAAPALFTDPGDVEMVCFDGNVDVRNTDPDAGLGERVVLPQRCCDDPTAKSALIDVRQADGTVKKEPRDKDCYGTLPLPHALVTQTLRGEVAAVDLRGERVLDSEKRIPGYTFIDVGGEPTAIVAPPCAGTAMRADPSTCGAPVFTYVAGRERSEVRAVASCRFRLGRKCGPEGEELGPDRVELVAQPHDMVLDPTGRALWLTLPDRGLLARVELGTDAETPFARDPADTTQPKAVAYFPLAAGLDLTPPEPVRETPYVMTCGLTYKYDPTLPGLKLPNAPHAASTLVPHPTRMQLLELAPGEHMLLVVDDGQGVVHALVPRDEQLEQRAVMPVGAPLRDFAVTPLVPALAPSAASLVSQPDDKGDPQVDPETKALLPPLFAYRDDADPSVIEKTKRYLYAVDARDGSLMAFDFSVKAGVPALTPLLAPAPARDSVRRFANFGDRLGLANDNVVARTLSVMDTRQTRLIDGSFDDDYCGEFSAEALQMELNDATDSKDTDRIAIATHNRDVRAKAEADAAPSALRGVFLMVATTSGSVFVVDVHDLDLQCRAQTQCEAKDSTQLSDKSSARGVAVQRHAVRLGAIKAATTSISGSDDLVADGDAGFRRPAVPEADAGEDAGVVEDPVFKVGTDNCPIGYYRVAGSAFVCAAANPWRSRAATWTATYRGGIDVARGVVGVLEEGEGENELVLTAPAGLDFCERGLASEGFAVQILSAPKEPIADGCKRETGGDPVRLLVRKAYTDRLELKIDPDTTSLTPKDLRACYADFVDFYPRLDDSFWRISVGGTVYLHRMMTAADGSCTVDTSLDERWTSVTDGTRPYWDSFIAFQLRELSKADADSTDAKEAISPSVTLTLNAGPITVNILSGRSDTLPTRMRFFPGMGQYPGVGQMFVVDKASQGLTPIVPWPLFQLGDTTYR